MSFKKLSIEDYILQIVQNFVDKPEEIKVTSQSGERTIVLSITANKIDVGKIVGKRGHVISAIRILGRSYVGPSGKRLEINIID